MILGIVHVALLVKAYEEAIEFYCDKLGFSVVEDTQLPDKRWIRLKSPGDMGSEILLSKAENQEQSYFVGKQAGGRVLFYLYTDDFDLDYELFMSKGIVFTEKPRVEDYGKVAVFKDLYGNRIDLIQFNGLKEVWL
jgi:catechol 2,3-dioxygenase-like lactoylglutathione lyase family enzyme